MVFRGISPSTRSDRIPFEPIAADFDGFESNLTDREKFLIVKLSGFLDEPVRPNPKGYAALSPFRQSGNETRQFSNSADFRAWLALHLTSW